MISFFAQLYLALQQKIKTGVPEIKWIDLDLGQLEHYPGERAMVAFPCVLVDFIGSRYDEDGVLDQCGQCTIQLRLGFSPFSSASSAAPDISKEAALQHYELEQKLFAALHGWMPSYGEDYICQPLIRTTVQSEQRNDAYRVRIINFTTAFEDNGAMKQLQKTTAKINLQIQ